MELDIFLGRIDEEKSKTAVSLKEMSIPKYDKAEFVIGKKASLDDNDFYLEIKKNTFKKYDIKEDDFIYIPNTEYCGIVKKINHQEDNIVLVSGPNLRFFLNKMVIFPDYNSSYHARDDYIIIKDMNANKAIEKLMQSTYYSAFFNLFRFGTKTDKTVSCQARYEYLYEKIISMLDESSLRLKITHSYDFENRNFIIEAVEKNVLNELYNDDLNIKINSTIDNTSKVDTIVALGKGDLHERKVILIKRTVENGQEKYQTVTDLSKNEEGTIDSAVYVYDYSSCESDEDLVAKAIDEFKENHTGTTSIEVSMSDSKKELQLGDIITSYDDVTKLNIETEITRKTLTIENGKVSIEYKVGD